VHAAIKKEESVDLVQKLQQENRRLQQENDQLGKQLLVYKQQGQYREKPRKTSSGRSGLIAFILTALVVAALIYFGLNSDKKGTQKTKKTATTSQQEKPRQVIGQYKVVAPRAYFYSNPDPGTRRNAFMIPSNDVIGALDEKNDFVYVEFTNDNGQTSKGWLRKQDLMTLDEWTRNQESQARLNEQDVQGQLKEARQFLIANKIKEAIYIYSFLSDQGVPEAMYEYGNLTLQNKNDALSCEEAMSLIQKASDKDYIPAKRTLGFLYIFAENKEVLQVSNYDRCNYDKNVYKGTQLLLQAALRGDSTAKRLMDEINAKRGENQPATQQ
jgi:eukaryotic-like serine/threonine-protein kinase